MKQRILLALVVTIVVFAILLVADRVLAGETFLPLINGGAAQTGNLTHVLYVFSSGPSISGNAGGRSGLNKICSNADFSAHACTLYEIENAMKTTGVYFNGFLSSDDMDVFKSRILLTLNTAKGGQRQPIVGVRRLTLVECERLQGYPGGWTEGQSDSARYRQLGNAVAVPVVEWIAKRIVKKGRVRDVRISCLSRSRDQRNYVAGRLSRGVHPRQ